MEVRQVTETIFVNMLKVSRKYNGATSITRWRRVLLFILVYLRLTSSEFLTQRYLLWHSQDQNFAHSKIAAVLKRKKCAKESKDLNSMNKKE